MLIDVLKRRHREGVQEEIKKEFMTCLEPQVARRVADYWWHEFRKGLRVRGDGHPSFLFIYDFTEQLCASTPLPGTKRPQIRRILTQAYYESGRRS